MSSGALGAYPLSRSCSQPMHIRRLAPPFHTPMSPLSRSWNVKCGDSIPVSPVGDSFIPQTLFERTWGDIDHLQNPNDPTKIDTAKTVTWINDKMSRKCHASGVNFGISFPDLGAKSAMVPPGQVVVPTQISNSQVRQLLFHLKFYIRCLDRLEDKSFRMDALYDMYKKIEGIESVKSFGENPPEDVAFAGEPWYQSGKGLDKEFYADPIKSLAAKKWSVISAKDIATDDIVVYFDGKTQFHPSVDNPPLLWGRTVKVKDGQVWVKSVWGDKKDGQYEVTHLLDHVSPEHGTHFSVLRHLP